MTLSLLPPGRLQEEAHELQPMTRALPLLGALEDPLARLGPAAFFVGLYSSKVMLYHAT